MSARAQRIVEEMVAYGIRCQVDCPSSRIPCDTSVLTVELVEEPLRGLRFCERTDKINEWVRRLCDVSAHAQAAHNHHSPRACMHDPDPRP